MGTAPFACPTLRQLFASSHQILAVVTQPDRPRGRGQKPAISAVKALALDHPVAILQPPSLRPAAVREDLAALRPEVIVVVAYGNILPAAILRLPPYGCVNLHASLLPHYRGAAPLNWTLIHGETVTGYTVIQMDEHVDTGPILWRATSPVLPDDDALTLGTRLAEAGAQGVLQVLQGLEAGTITATPQPETGVSYAPKLTRELGRLDWQQSANTLHNLVRGLIPWPSATVRWHETDVKLWRTTPLPEIAVAPPGTITAIAPAGITVACGAQHLLLQEVQPANRRRMAATDFAQGYRVQPGDHFDQDNTGTDRSSGSAPHPPGD